ncbi:shikimate 5-dehydrogenase [Gryllotalpicola protaetiae]|uniref:Shikimate 5-dehydrogenase n=1 Tax=Gryllotalpicola protaetiae TaxID=2419771 RepID=A0A387BUP2_9MICO|nr:shikimate 5-dehydrogenase [Gryllotalpicola protaetiae]AYG04786.1 shikimate 5-dehydrogenase [Gryllotalpicola protaetiae]
MTRPELNKSTRLCISLAARPSNHGTRFHNWLYEQLGLDFVYKAMTTTDIDAAIGGVRALGIRGCSVSMPWKEAVIPLVDELTPSAAAIQSVNTIVNTDGRLTAYNTDYLAIEQLIASHGLSRDEKVLLRGSGGMGRAVAAAFRDAGFAGTIAARNPVAGQGLAAELGWDWAEAPDGITAPIIVNVTPIGMAGGADAEAQAFSDEQVAQASVVFDVVAMPVETPLIRAGRAAGKHVVTGSEVIALQAAAQFELYTGVAVTPEQVAAAEEYASRD